MFIKNIIDTKTKVEYTLESNSLGEGATAKVWPGRNVQDPRQPTVAVKIAHRGTTVANLTAFWDELDIVDKLAQTEAKRNVPWAHKGQTVNANLLAKSDQPAIIIMELIPDEWQLTRQFSNGQLPVELALDSAEQYAVLLVALHREGLTTRGDRKATDLRWDAALQRLIVLDWNRAAKIPSANKDDYIRQDLRGFGQLWSEMVLGRAVSSLPEIDDETTPGWTALPRGLRRILVRSRNSGAAWGYQTAQELAGDVIRFRGLYKKAFSNPKQIWKQAEEIYRKGQTASQTEQSELADQLLTVGDLLLKAQPGIVTDPNFKVKHEWAKKYLSLATALVEEAVKQIDRHLQVDSYQAADRAAQDALNKLKGENIDIWRAALRLCRWRTITQVGIEGSNLKKEMLKPVKALQQCVASIEQAARMAIDTPQTKEKLREVRNYLQEAIRLAGQQGVNSETALQPLRLELDIRDGVVAATYAKQSKQLAEADQEWDKIKQYLNVLEQVDSLYAKHLRTCMPPLETSQPPQASTELEEKQNDFNEALEKLVDTLLEKKLPENWPDLTETVQYIRQLYRELRQLPVMLPDTIKTNYDFVSRLSDVNDCLVLDISEALEISKNLPQTATPLSPADRSEIIVHYQKIALAYVERLTSSGQWAWPNQLEQALAVVEKLAQVNIVNNELQERLDQWQEKLTEYRQRLGLVQNGQFVNDPERLLSRLDDETVGDTLHEISDKCPIEIFDRRGLTQEQLEKRRVVRVLSAWYAARLVNKINNLATQLGEATKALQREATNLTEIETAYIQYKEMEAELGAARIGEIRTQIQRVSELNTELQQAEGWRSQIEQIAQNLPGTISKVEEEKSRANSVISEANSQAIELDRVYHSLVRIQNQIDGLGGTILQNEAIIFETAITSGLQAARQLKLDAATECLELAQKWQPRNGPLLEKAQVELKFLKEAVDWLGKIQVSFAYNDFCKWRNAVLSGQVDLADVTWKQLGAHLFSNPDLLSGWVMGELWDQYIALRQRIRTDDEPLKTILNKIVEQIDRRLNLRETERYLCRVKKLEAEWQTLNGSQVNNWTDGPSIENLLTHTEQLVMDPPTNLQPQDWSGLKAQLTMAYNRLANLTLSNSKDLDRWLVWLGILRVKVEQICSRPHPAGTYSRTVPSTERISG